MDASVTEGTGETLDDDDTPIPQQMQSSEKDCVTKSTIISPEEVAIQEINKNITTATSIEDEIPDIEKLTIKNLDTGEQYIIGENDPDFDFDTFELRKGVEATPIVATVQQQQEADSTSECMILFALPSSS